MITTYKIWKEELDKALRTRYYRPTCDFCHQELFIGNDELKRTESSDYQFKCPVCGHTVTTPANELYNLHCSYYGDNNVRFALDDKETEEARKFIAKHDHSEELCKKKGNPFFSTLGQQFTYEIIPGGLGDSVIIKCNHCKETKDITNIDNW